MSEKYTPRVLDALNTRGLAGKREYVRGLEQRRDEEALSLLVECLCDESSYLRELAEDALLRIGDRAAPVLLPLLDQGLWYTRSSAARVLGRLARRDAIPGLQRLAVDANASVREAAREALELIARHHDGALGPRDGDAIESEVLTGPAPTVPRNEPEDGRSDAGRS